MCNAGLETEFETDRDAIRDAVRDELRRVRGDSIRSDSRQESGQNSSSRGVGASDRPARRATKDLGVQGKGTLPR